MDNDKIAQTAIEVLGALAAVVSGSLPATVAVIVARSLIKEYLSSYVAETVNPDQVTQSVQTLLNEMAAHDKKFDELLAKKLASKP